MSAPVPVWVWGARGMLAGETMRLLEGHPDLVLEGAVSREPGRPLGDLHPHLATSLRTSTSEEALARLAADDGPALLILGLPHRHSSALWPRLAASLSPEVRVVDLAADFRLRDARRFEKAYGAPHPAPRALEEFAYGLPELAEPGSIECARRVAAPGCFATALQLATLPAARARRLDADAPWHFFAVTGSSGSGSTPGPGTHHPYRSGNLWAYALGGHRHEAELEQALQPLGCAPALRFIPHSGPFVRGIHLTASLPLAKGTGRDAAGLRADYEEAFGECPFVEVLASGVPDLRRVVGSNRASIALEVRDRTLYVLCALDNLIKGGAGQALQCSNRMLGLPETTGLARAGLGGVG